MGGVGAGYEATGRLRLRLLDGFAVAVDGRAVPDGAWPSRKARQLLKLLALAPGHRVPRDAALEALWPDLTAGGATRALYQALFLLRRTLEPDAPRRAPSRYVRLDRDRVALVAPDGVETDLAAFGHAAATGLGTGTPAALRAALALGGEVLPDDRYEEWTLGPRRAHREQRLALLTALAAAHERAGQSEAAVVALRRVLELEPAHEPAHAGLMRLYAAAGRRDEALRQYARLERALREELGAAPDAETQRLHAALLAGALGTPPRNVPATGAAVEAAGPAVGSKSPGDVAAAGPAPAPAGLPRQLTSFVGRDAELVEVARLLEGAPLVTLTGPGGVGKTRLALAVASQAADAWPDGVWFVDLAPLAEPSLVPQTVAAALGVREVAGQPLAATLSGRQRTPRLLLVLDNCEHVVEAAARLAEGLLRACPGVRVLATSREPLGVPGEAVFRVPPLPVPPVAGAVSASELRRYPATRLFLERAALRGAAVADTHAPAVAEVCRRLDGLPLAIELAAARLGALGPEELAARLEQRFRLLAGGSRTAPPRQQTLRATLDWSHDLLTGPERTLFARLAVFAGGFTLEAAEAVCGEGLDVLDLLPRLVDKSLVVAQPAPAIRRGAERSIPEEARRGAAPFPPHARDADATGESGIRYSLLETVRAYARAPLEAGGETPAVASRHADYYLTFDPGTPEQFRHALARGGRFREPTRAWLTAELDNVRTALRWSLEHGAAGRGLAFAVGPLVNVWALSGRLAEPRRWLDAFLGAGEDLPVWLRAAGHSTAGWWAQMMSDHREARSRLETGVALWREAGETPVDALASLGRARWLDGDDEGAVEALREALAAAEAAGSPLEMAASLRALSYVARGRGDYPTARALLAQSIDAARGGILAGLASTCAASPAWGGSPIWSTTPARRPPSCGTRSVAWPESGPTTSSRTAWTGSPRC